VLPHFQALLVADLKHPIPVAKKVSARDRPFPATIAAWIV
jgi:hypothetical protein